MVSVLLCLLAALGRALSDGGVTVKTYENVALAGPPVTTSVVCGLFHRHRGAVGAPRCLGVPPLTGSRLCPVAQIKIDSRSICS